MKKVFMLSVAGPYNHEEERTPHFPLGIVYTQQGQLFAVIALMEKFDGIEKIAQSLDSNNSVAAKAANSRVRKLELPNVHFDNGKTVTYSRLNTALRNDGRVILYKTDEDGDEEKAYVVYKMGVNEWPNVFENEKMVEPEEWWQNPERFTD